MDEVDERWSSRMTISRWRILPPALVFALVVPTVATAQEDPPQAGARIHRSIPPPGAKTHMVVPGERFEAGSLHRWFYGDNYRNLWTTAIEVPVLDLDSVGGGLTPLRTGGAGQSISLHFTGEDGVRYTVRSLDKDPTRRLPDDINNSVVTGVLQDLISTLMPAAALVVDPLMDATGILHSKHGLVVIPDDPRLGKYRARFAGLIGTLQEHPSEGADDTPGFAGSRRVSGTERVWEGLEDSSCERVDARAFLEARLMDFFIGDKDRHPGQWRWARLLDGDCYAWLPIPEDRDQAFIHHGGVAMMLIRLLLPRAIRFDDTYPNLLGLTITSWELDREFLVELDKPAWDAVVESFRAALPDSVIEDAVRRLPAPYHEIAGDRLERTLKARRDALPRFVDRYYELISRQVDILATDEDEHARIEHLPNGDIVLRIGVAGDSGEEVKPPYFERTFRHDETSQVRLYLRGGADRAEVSGADGEITVHIDGGGGSDTFINTSGARGSKTRFYDYRGQNVFVKGAGASIDERRYRRPPNTAQPWHPLSQVSTARYAVDWGMLARTSPFIWADPDLGAFVRVLHSRTYMAFRKHPFASRHEFALGLAARGFKPLASYAGTFPNVWAHVDARLNLEYSAFEVIRFSGFGNDFRLEHPTSFYDVKQQTFLLTPTLELHERRRDADASGDATDPPRPELAVSLGPVLKWSRTPLDSNRERFIGQPDRQWYGTGSFGQIGLRTDMEYDHRDNPRYPTGGLFVRVAAAGYPAVWDAESAFGSVDGEVRTYLTAPIPTNPTLALRMGGKKVWGNYPFFESAFLGGPGRLGLGHGEGPVRGLRKNRFAGDASLYANVELRLVLSRIEILVPGEFGLFGAADVGRVFYAGDPDDANEWHNGTGGGFWFSFLERSAIIRVALMKGRDMTSVYIHAQMF